MNLDLLEVPNLIDVKGFDCIYEGEVNNDNKPHGHGLATGDFGTQYNSTFVDGVLHGVCK